MVDYIRLHETDILLFLVLCFLEETKLYSRAIWSALKNLHDFIEFLYFENY